MPATPEYQVRPLEAHQADAMSFLFESYPYKAAQRHVQKLDQEKLNAFYLAQLKKDLAAGQKRWVAWMGDVSMGLAGLTPDAWHTSVYGLGMGKITPWLSHLKRAAGEAMLDRIFNAAEEDLYHHLSIRIDGEDFPALHLLEAAGFNLMDVSMKYSRPMPWGHDVVEPKRKGWSVRLIAPEDQRWVRELGAKTHGNTHFLNDPFLPRERTEALFDAWVARCIESLAYHIYILVDPDGCGRGFVIYLRNRPFAAAVGPNPIILDYVIIDPALRGAGCGPWFIQETLKREADSGFDYCELRTSQHNHAAVACYEKLGFRLCATDFTLHKKLTSPPAAAEEQALDGSEEPSQPETD